MVGGEKYPSVARDELRSSLRTAMLLVLLAAVVLTSWGVVNFGTLTGWLSLSGGALAAWLAVGIYRLREWARWTLAICAGLFCLAGLIEVIRNGLAPSIEHLIDVLVLAFWGATVVYLASPSTGKVFEVARNQWVPRSKRAQAKAQAEDGAAIEPVSSPR